MNGGPKPATFRRAIGLFAPYRRKTAVWIATILGAAALGVVAPLLTKVVFDDALFPKSGHPNVELLIVLIALMLGAILLGGALAVVQTYLANVIGQQVMHGLRQELYGHLRRMSLAFFTATRTGEIQSRMANDVGGVGLVVTETASVLLSNAIFVLAALVAMAYLSWPLTLFSLVIVPGFILFGRRIGRELRRMSASTQETLSEMSVITQETLSVSGALLTKMFDSSNRSEARYKAESERLAALRVRQELLSRAFLGLSQTFFLAAPALLYLAAGLVLTRGSVQSISPGSLVAFTVLQSRLFFPMRDLMGMTLQLHTASALFDRVFEYLDLPQDVVDRPGASTVDKGTVRGRLVLRDVCFRYDVPLPEGSPSRDALDTRPWTLDHLNLTIEPGQLAAIVGPTGAGKTTISYLVPRLYDVCEGSVEVDGTDVRDIRLASLGEIVGMVTQETDLLHATVRENLLFAKPNATDHELEQATVSALIHDRILEFPEGFDTVVGERGYRLSGGEKQRLAIARVILKDPRILILDEATSALDTVSERLVQEALASVISGRTTIAIAHRLSTILAADVIFVLDRGRLVEQGTHEELLARGGLFSRLYDEQFRGGRIEARCENGLVLSSGQVVTNGEQSIPATTRT